MWRLVALLMIVTLLAACGGASGGVPGVAAAPESVDDASAGAGTSERGNRVKAIGEPAFDYCEAGSTDPNTCALEFTLDRITECESAPPGNGVRRVLWWTAKARPTWKGENINPIDVFRLRVVSADGVSRNVELAGDGECLPSQDYFPDGRALQPSTTYVGGNDVVLPAESGTLVLTSVDGQGGWEWQLPG
jgi:hypothetical protein